MPPKKVEKKKARKNKRKSRTEVESSSSSDEQKSSVASSSPSSTKKKAEAPAPQSQDEDSDSSVQENSTISIPPEKKQSKQDPDQLFEEFYLRQATKEFANDLDKLRSAGDFHGERSVAMLVRALKGGTRGFEKGERKRVVGGE